MTNLFRMLAPVKWFDWVGTKKNKINSDKRTQLTGDQLRALYFRACFIVVPLDCISVWFANRTVDPMEQTLTWQSFMVEYAYFIPKSLVFEVVFDLFHYATHWMCHRISWLYVNSHKRHHIHRFPCPLSTYEQDGLDVCLTNVLPFCLSWFLCFFSFSNLQLHLLLAYKSYVEVAGHSGLDVKGFSFPQMPLLNNLTSICSRVHDHEVHHTYPRWNFAKRFSLWDKVFCTFRPGESHIESSI
ncbi:fatty acid hydroxylase [Plasmopara halstedii]|uniref:Fatty acid hydroxylase n=1 Tax=Plasmopara halstedii TaxID=4781 RepID=A0A0P1ABG1_PLAHL|nr:fatty acid hydroxylase [Plasmopara halstedii]CEG37966.1 fatty acid hydroxylase [Plasmopara halstedii]|eukprot:XP_024574335.1 fatty acid hydroxylase [Plasmopara halstedii]